MDVDRPLVEAAAAGSRAAFDELICRHQTAILNLMRALTVSAADAEDLAQEVFVRAWRSLRTFRGDSSFRTWLCRVAINVARTDRARRRNASRWVQPAADAREPESGEAPIDAILARRQMIERALASLPDDLRAAITLRDLQGLEYREIAQVLEIPIGTVESRIFRARQQLKGWAQQINDGGRDALLRD